MELPQYDERIARRIQDAPTDDLGIIGYLGVRHAEVGPGTLRAEMDVRAELLNPAGNLHGGVIAALCDHVLGTVCYPVIPRGAWAATTEFKLNYLAPVTTGTLEASAVIVSLTRSTAVVRIDVTNRDGGDDRLVCTAQGTVLIKLPKP